VVLVATAVLRSSFGQKGSRATGVVLTVALVASVAVPLWVRGPGEMPVPVVPRVNTGALSFRSVTATVTACSVTKLALVASTVKL
jgi:hypothetical protein